jgi:5-keto 4-deoxyuronate isomerase
MEKQDGYYIGKEIKDIQFISEDPANRAKFYTVSVPAHHKYPNVKISIYQIKPKVTGDTATLNHRSIYRYIHPNMRKLSASNGLYDSFSGKSMEYSTNSYTRKTYGNLSLF